MFKVSYKTILNSSYDEVFKTFKEARDFYKKLKRFHLFKSIFIYVVD